MSLDISGGRSLGIHRQDLSLDVLADAGLVLFQHLRPNLGFPIPGRGYFYIAEACAQPFTAVPISAVIRVLIFASMLAVTQLVIQLRLQAILHEFGDGLIE